MSLAPALRLAVIGDPVAHSASPGMFSWLARRLGLALTYEAVQVPAASLSTFLDEMRAGRWNGLSVTIPHKHAVLAMADLRDPVAARIGAANCLTRTGEGRLAAFNTDGEGLVRALGHHRVSLGGAAVLLLGAGGAARAAAAAARDAGASRLWIANRHPKGALQLASELEGEPLPLTAEALGPALSGADVLIQATPVGLDMPGDSPLPPGCVLHDRLTVMDMVYRPLRTRLLREAEAAGARAIDGLWMLVFQGLAQLRLWTGVEIGPDVAPALHAVLAEGG